MQVLGRDRESARVETLFAGGCRAISISGRTGVGKTALLGALAEWCAESDVWMVDLDDTGDAGFWTAVARTLGISAPTRARTEREAAMRVAGAIAQASVLLVVDHADGYSLDSSEVSAVLDACHRLRLIVVRSAPPGEPFADIPLVPFDVPPLDTAADGLLDFASVRLFIDRAQRADARFRVDRATLEAVAQICRLVGGLPLALELAAARVRIIPADRLARELSEADSIQLLSSRRDTGRHGLREALAATVRTLEDGDRQLLEGLSSFVGPFPFDAAVTIHGRPAGEVADALERLADLRLLDPGEYSHGEPFFSVLPIVRRFVTESGVRPETLSGRGKYLEQTLVDADEAWARAESASALAQARGLRRDLLAEARARFAEDALGAAAWIVACAELLADEPALTVIGELLEKLIATVGFDRLPGAVRARVLLWSAYALAFSSDGEALAELIRERWRTGAALIDERAEPLLALHSRLICIVIAVTTGDLLPAVQAAQEGRAMSLAQAQPTWAARFAVWLAAATHAAGQVGAAISLALDALHHGQRVMDAYAVAGATIILRTVPAEELPPDAAIPSLEDALALVRREREVLFEWFILGALTHAELVAQHPREAAHWCAARLAQGPQRGWTYLAAISLVHTVLIAAALGDFAVAARMLGAIDADRDRILRSMTSGTTAEVARARALIAGRLGAAHAAAIMAAGSVMSLPDAAAEAVTWLRAHAADPEHAASTTDPVPAEALTPREREVLSVLADGHPNKAIAQRLGVSTKTVMHHSVAIYRKLGVRGRAEATAYAHRHGLVYPAPPAA